MGESLPLHSSEQPHITNEDDAYFADTTHWVDINADLNVHYPPQEVTVTVENEYQQVRAKLLVLTQRRGSDGVFGLYTTDDSGNSITLGEYLMYDLNHKFKDGKITKEEQDQLFKEGLAIAQGYKPSRRPSSEYPIAPGDDELDWRDPKERAANEDIE
jgi:hypothetical protein